MRIKKRITLVKRARNFLLPLVILNKIKINLQKYTRYENPVYEPPTHTISINTRTTTKHIDQGPAIFHCPDDRRLARIIISPCFGIIQLMSWKLTRSLPPLVKIIVFFLCERARVPAAAEECLLFICAQPASMKNNFHGGKMTVRRSVAKMHFAISIPSTFIARNRNAVEVFI